MKIAIFGSDPRSVAIGRLLVDAGYHVCFGDVEDVSRAEAAAKSVGAVADTPYNDAAVCEMLVFAGPRSQMDDLLAKSGSISSHAVVVDAMEGELPDGGSGSELLARKLNSHRVVRALIVLPQAGANIMYCGDDADAMTMVEEVFRTAGCATTDCGGLANAAEIEASSTAPDSGSSQQLQAANAQSSQ